MKGNRKNYSKEFNQNALVLSYNVGGNVQEVSSELGMCSGLIYRWRMDFKSNKQLKPKEKELGD